MKRTGSNAGLAASSDGHGENPKRMKGSLGHAVIPNSPEHQSIWIANYLSNAATEDVKIYGLQGMSQNKLLTLPREKLLELVLMIIPPVVQDTTLRGLMFAWQRLTMQTEGVSQLEIQTLLFGDDPRDFRDKYDVFMTRIQTLKDTMIAHKLLDPRAPYAEMLRAELDGVEFRLCRYLQLSLIQCEIRNGQNTFQRVLLELLKPTDNGARLQDAANTYTTFPQVMDAILAVAQEEKLVRIDNLVHKPIYTKKGEFTGAYEPWRGSGDLVAFIFSTVTPREKNPELYGKLFERTNYWYQLYKLWSGKDGMDDPRFPKITLDRMYHAFENGWYYLKTDTFYPYDSHAFRQMFYGSRQPIFPCNYYPVPFRNELYEYCRKFSPNGLLDIPSLASVAAIPKLQKWCDEEIKWWWAEGGKLLYPLREMDGWQRVTFNMGCAGSGKTTTAQIWAQFMPRQKVGLINNRVEPLFTLQSSRKAWIWIGVDIDENWNIDPKLFNQIVEGTWIPIPIKGQEAEMHHWLKPGIINANGWLALPNPNGELSRRLIVHLYTETPGDKANPRLIEEMMANDPGAVLKTANVMYLEKKDKHRVLMDSAFPANMQKNMRELLQASNPLVPFLEDPDAIVLNPNYFMDYSMFEKAFKIWIYRKNPRGLSTRKTPLSLASVFNSTLRKFHCKVVADPKELPFTAENEYKRPVDKGDGQIRRWIVGCSQAKRWEWEQPNFVPTEAQKKEMAEWAAKAAEMNSAQGLIKAMGMNMRGMGGGDGRVGGGLHRANYGNRSAMVA